MSLLLLVASAPALAGAATLHNLFSSNMVLQAEAPRVFGANCTAAQPITVTTQLGEAVKAVCDAADGTWMAALSARNASKPEATGEMITIDLGGGSKKVLADVLFGDIWVVRASRQ